MTKTKERTGEELLGIFQKRTDLFEKELVNYEKSGELPPKWFIERLNEHFALWDKINGE